MHRIIFLLIPLLSSIHGNCIELESKSNISTSKNDNDTIIINNSNYLYNKINNKFIILEETKTSTITISMDNARSKIKTTAWVENSAKNQNKIWSIETPADESSISEFFYATTKRGEPAQNSTTNYYNMENGNKVFSSSSNFYEIRIPNTDKNQNRFIGFHSASDVSIEPEIPSNKNIIGILSYNTTDTSIEKVLLISKEKPEYYIPAPKISATTNDNVKQEKTDTALTIWPTNPAKDQIKNERISINLEFDDGTLQDKKIVIKVNVLNDKLVLSPNALPKGLFLEKYKPSK